MSYTAEAIDEIKYDIIRIQETLENLQPEDVEEIRLSLVELCESQYRLLDALAGAFENE